MPKKLFLFAKIINSFMTGVPIIRKQSKWTGLYMIGTSVMKELICMKTKVLCFSYKIVWDYIFSMIEKITAGFLGQCIF